MPSPTNPWLKSYSSYLNTLAGSVSAHTTPFSPDGWSRYYSDEQDPTPAERMACWEDKYVLQEERVQLC